MSIGLLTRLALMLALCLAGCTDFVDRHELPPAGDAQPYKDRFEYRYGESPRTASGALVWASPAAKDAALDLGWQEATTLSKPPGRQGRQQLWLRTVLHGPKFDDAVFYAPYVRQSFEAFLDGKLIAHFGQVEGPLSRRFPGKRGSYLPIGPDYNGKLLVLRIHSAENIIGIWGQSLLGSRAAVLTNVVHSGLSTTLLGTIFFALGCVLFFLYIAQRSDSAYLWYSFSSLLLGIYLVGGSPFRVFFFEEPIFWYHVELGSLCLLGAAVSQLTAKILAPGPLRIMEWLAYVFAGFFLGMSGLLLAGKIQIGFVLMPLQILWLVLVLLHIFIAIAESFRGNLDAKTFGIGMMPAALITLYEMLQQLLILPRVMSVVHYAGAVLMATLGVILLRRFRALHKRLTDYSTVMQLSFSSAQDLSPGHQAQIALAELLRILKAHRGLIFLCSDQRPDALDCVAGRDDVGNVLVDPQTQAEHDEQLVQLVQKKRRPLTRERTAMPASDEEHARKRHSAVASPLMARGELLGVIYLEAHESRAPFHREDVEILLGLGNQVALTLMATRAGRLESESAAVQKQLSQQEALLEAAARMARGDLQSAIEVPESSELLPLAQALDSMRRDLLIKFHTLESSNAAVKQHNEELRHKIDDRLRRLMELAERTAAKSKSARDRASTPGTSGFSTAVTALKSGTILAESYRVISLLGEGRSGSVYEVERTTDGTRLAVKVLFDRSDKTVSMRFAREAQIMARLSHPNVVAIIDVDMSAEGLVFMVMELVRGTPLHHFRERFGNLDFALPVLRQIADGLRTVHAHNIVHRDLKPANVIISESREGLIVKLVDFGVSTLARGKSQTDLPAILAGNSNPQLQLSGLADEPAPSTPRSGHLTAVGMLVGTPMYLAPELTEGSRLARPPADIFSFGVIAYELVAKTMPFSEPPVVTRYRGEALRIPPLQKAATAAELSPAMTVMASLIGRCLAEDPAIRPTAEEILAVLAALPD